MRKASHAGHPMRVAAAVAAITFAAGCGDRTTTLATGPKTPQLPPAPAFTIGTQGLAFVRGLARSRDAQAESAHLRISAKFGGTLDLAHAGFHLAVPPGAVSGDVTISVTVIPGDRVAYDFQPHGLSFARPLIVTQSLAGTPAYGNRAIASRLIVGYFSGGPSMLGPTAAALTGISELEPTELDGDSSALRIFISHFSGYIVALGDAPPPDDPVY